MSENQVSPLEEVIRDAAAAQALVLKTELRNSSQGIEIDTEGLRVQRRLSQVRAQRRLSHVRAQLHLRPKLQQPTREPAATDFVRQVDDNVRLLLGHAVPTQHSVRTESGLTNAEFGAINAAAAIAEYEVGRQLLLDDPTLDVLVEDVPARELLDAEWRVELDNQVRSAALNLGTSEEALRAEISKSKIISPAIRLDTDTPGRTVSELQKLMTEAAAAQAFVLKVDHENHKRFPNKPLNTDDMHMDVADLFYPAEQLLGNLAKPDLPAPDNDFDKQVLQSRAKVLAHSSSPDNPSSQDAATDLAINAGVFQIGSGLLAGDPTLEPETAQTLAQQWRVDVLGSASEKATTTLHASPKALNRTVERLLADAEGITNAPEWSGPASQTLG